MLPYYCPEAQLWAPTLLHCHPGCLRRDASELDSGAWLALEAWGPICFLGWNLRACHYHRSRLLVEFQHLSSLLHLMSLPKSPLQFDQLCPHLLQDARGYVQTLVSAASALAFCAHWVLVQKLEVLGRLPLYFRKVTSPWQLSVVVFVCQGPLEDLPYHLLELHQTCRWPAS